MPRPAILVKPIRKQVTLDLVTIQRLRTLHPSVSESIRMAAAIAVPQPPHPTAAAEPAREQAA